MKKIITIITVSSLLSLTGCASIVSGNQQSVSVKTGSTQGAVCELANNKGKWYVNGTPGSVTVSRSFSDLDVRCTKSGSPVGHRLVASHTKPMAFGNIIFGGAIGAGVDIASGAAYDYPVEIDVPMRRA
jgi:uncharacterized protein YceK